MTIINRGWNGDISSMNHLDLMAYSDEPTTIESARAALGKSSIRSFQFNGDSLINFSL